MNRKFIPGLAVAAILVAVVVLVIYPKKDSEGPSKPPSESTPVSSDFYDWQMGVSEDADKIRELVSVPLVTMRNELLIYNLITELKGDSSSKVVMLRNSAYWSDKKALLAEQVTNAFSRFQEIANKTPGFKCKKVDEETCSIWKKAIKVEKNGLYSFKIIGCTTDKCINELLVSDYLRPIRSDLIGKNLNGWKVTIGKFTYPDNLNFDGNKPSNVTLVANPQYYSMRHNETKVINFN